MKKVKILLACLILATSSWAANVTLKPVNELAFRTTGGVTATKDVDTTFQAPTDWAKGFPKIETEATHAIECTYSAEFFVLQMYDVTEYDLNFVSSLTLTFNMLSTNTYKLGAWIYPDADWTEADQKEWTEGQCPIVEKFKSVVGVYPGHVNTGKTYLVQAVCSDDKAIQTMTFSGDALKALAKGAVKKGDKVYLSLIITFSETEAGFSKSRNPKMYCMTADEAKQPVMSFDMQVVDYNQPIGLYQYRPKTNGSGFDSKEDGSTTATIELNNSARIFCIGQYIIPDFDKSAVYNFYFKRNANNYQDILIFNWPEYEHSSITASEANSTFETIVGFAPGVMTTAANDSIQTSCYRKNDSILVAVPGTNITPLFTDAWGNTHINLLLLNKKYTSGSNSNIKIYSNSANTSDVNKPSWTIASYANVYNETQELTYDDLQAACGAANANDIIRVNNDLSTDARINITTNPVTIYGRTADTKIKFTTRGQLMFLTNNYAGKTYIKNLTLVNDNTKPRDHMGIEVNKPIELENVTFVSEAGYNEEKYDVQAKQANVTLVGNNVIPGGIKVENGRRIDDGIDGSSPRTTHTTPIAVTMNSIGENTMVVAHGWGARRDMYQLTNEGYALYVVAGSGDLKAFAVQPISLSETEDNAELIAKYKGISTDITLSRTIAGSATDYSTICLPFETTKDELGAAEVYQYDNATINGESATLHFVPATDLEAGKPYLVRFASEKENIVFPGKTITAATPGKYGDDHYEFIGLYNQTKITDDATKSLMYLGSANTLYWASENCTIKGSRGYIQAVSEPAKTVRRVAIGGHQAPTDIEMHDAQCAAMHDGKFLINGQFVIVKDNKMFNAQGQIIK